MLDMTIDGKAAATVARFDVVNPAIGAVEAQAPACTPEQLDEAMAAAERAYRSWRRDDDARRAALRALADAVDANQAELTRLHEEQFGPAIPLLSYDSVAEAVDRANSTHYGLSGSVWSADADRAADVAGELVCGTVWINTHAILPPHVPFSGAKMSGLGVANGVDGLISFTEPQVVHRVRA
jgi:acyl-CoA reductase-like NAD-dependent aldehyde dehydrogenase